jgi:hypothetical protein
MYAIDIYEKIYMQQDQYFDIKRKAGCILLHTVFHPEVSWRVPVDEIYNSMSSTGFWKEKKGRQYNIKFWVSS